ncbi:MAG: chemotaxis protein CheW [Betaproteobacteria bacterium]|nr:chemotaxis protein CheW [Betaproteobacteria bacterium]
MAEIVPYQQTAPAPTPDAAEQHQYLTFELAGEPFAIGILAIREIIEFGGLTTVPMMPEFIRGVINLRGSVVPVLDLAARFGRPHSTITRRSCIVILESHFEDNSQDIGVIVDTVQEVLEIPSADTPNARFARQENDARPIPTRCREVAAPAAQRDAWPAHATSSGGLIPGGLLAVGVCPTRRQPCPTPETDDIGYRGKGCRATMAHRQAGVRDESFFG